MTKAIPRSAIPFTFSISGSPDLVFYSRPEDLSFAYKKRLNRYITRGGIVEEDWGDELDRINGQGWTDGFRHPTCGYTRFHAKETEVYQEFLRLIDFYRKNGFEWTDDGVVVEAIDETLQPKDAIVLTYRDSKYRGFFESLNWSESAERPNQFSWGFDFVVVRTIYGY